MKNWVRFLLLCLFCPQLWGQVNVTATIVDTDGQAWINGNYAVSLVLPPGVTKYYDKNTGLPFTDTFQGGLDGTGSLSLTLIPTGQISPAGTTWKFIICPQVLGAGCGDTAFPVNGTGSLSAQLNAVIPVPRVTGGPGVYAYNDMEVAAFAPNTYFNVISQKNRCYQTSWDVCGSGTGGATLPTNAIVYGLSPLTSRAAIPGQDFLSPSITNGMVPLGIATPGVNQASNIFQFQSNYCTNSTPCNPAVDTLSIQSVPVNNSQNPLMQMIFGHSGSPGGAVGLFQFPVFLPTGSTAVTQAPGDTSTDIANDAFVAAAVAAATGVPAGPNNSIQYNCSGAFCGDSALLFNPTTKALTIGPTGSVAGSNSGPLLFNSLYETGTGLALQTFDFHVQIGSGVNPFSQLVIDGPGCPGGCEVLDLLGWSFRNNVEIQSPYTLVIDALTPSSPVCTDPSSILSTSCSGGGGGAMTPQQFGAHGDGLVIGNGCTTNGTATIVCAAGPFVSGDAGSGKFLCVAGAGAAGIGFCSTISTFVSSTTVTVAATPSTTVTSAQSSFGHDDVVALQNCYNGTSAGVPCVMDTPIGYNTPAGYLIVSAGLIIPTKANIQGAASNQGTTIISEFNGDAFSLPTSTASLQAGQPIEAVTLSNFTVFHDPSWPNGRSFHFNAAPGVFGFGGMFNSTINDVNSENAALECLWLDGHTNSDNNPNQYITFNQFKCNTADQMHTAAAIKITGIQAQIIFMNGSVDGPTLHSNAPNPLVYLGEKTTGQGDSPVDVKFFGFTCERTTSCYSVNNGTNNIHVDNSYIEAVDSPLIASNTFGLTFRGNHIANSGNVGAVAQFSGSVSATLQDNFTYGSTPPAAFAVCSGGTNNFNIDFLNNNSTLGASANCVTNHEGTGAALFQAFGTTDTVDASSVVITTIRNPNVQPGKTLTLKALSGGVGSFSLGTGGTPSGNDYPIDLGTFTSPLVITAGNSVTLALLDVSGAPVYTVVGGTSLPATILASSETVASSANPIWSTAFATTYMVLGGNVTGPTLAAGADGQHKTLCFKQGAGSFTVASPTNFKGFFTVGTVNGGLNCQSFNYVASISFWVADGPGKTDQ